MPAALNLSGYPIGRGMARHTIPAFATSRLSYVRQTVNTLLVRKLDSLR